MSSATLETIPLQEKKQIYDVEIHGLTKRFGKTTVVNDLTLKIPRGSFLGLIGANGAGKSTTLKMLAGMLEHDDGSAQVLGTSIENLGPKQMTKIGYVPESHQIYRWMTVSQTIWFCRRLNPRWNEGTCSELLSLFRLDESKKIRSLSKGMLAKLGLVLAISHDPELLILDEPMSGLDPIAREDFMDGVLKALTRRECTVILSSHSIDDVQRLSDSIGFIHAGRLLMHRTTDDILSKARRIHFVVDEGANPPKLDSAVWVRNENREWYVTVSDFSPLMMEKLNYHRQVHHVEVQELSLEEVYKDYIRGQVQ